MSYSVGARAKDKDELKARIAEQLDNVIPAQPAHAVDIPTAKAQINALIDLHPNNLPNDLTVTVSGWLSWQGGGDPASTMTACNINCTIGYAQ